MIACGNRQTDRGVVYRMPTPLASRFVHITVRADVAEWCSWAATQKLAPEVIFFVQMRPDLLHSFDPKSSELAFPCPRTWEVVARIVQSQNSMNVEIERSIFSGTVGEAAAIEFMAFLRIWRDLPHPQTILMDPAGAPIPENASALIATCGSLYRLVDDTNFDAIMTYAKRLREEVGEFLISSCIKQNPELQYTTCFVNYITAKQ